MIIITGATGKLGKLIVEKLLTKLPADKIGATCRNIEAAEALAKRGVCVRQADFEKPETLTHAFRGAKQVLIVSSNASRYGGDPITQHKNAIEAVKLAGAEKVLYTSHMGANLNSKFPPMRDHAATEAILESSGMAWTALRNGFYAESSKDIMGDFYKSFSINAPIDGKINWTSHDDLAEAAAIMICDHQDHQGITEALIGVESLDLSDLASIASSLTGKTVSRSFVSDEEMRDNLLKGGMHEKVIAIFLGLFEASRNGEFAGNNETLFRLLGRPPSKMAPVISQIINSNNDG
jgi:uncharacterized protein YbjT (DUF2867 family)